MEQSIYGYILRYSKRQQVVLTIMAALSFPFLYAFYELPKMIVNQAIQGKGTTFPVELAGFSFAQLDFLFLLCGAFLALVLVNQAFKYVINVYRGLTGERLLRRLRFDLYSRVLRFPLPVFRKKSSGEMIAMITSEVEPLGGFIGDAFSLPAFQGGTLLVILGFLMVQNPIMAAAAVALYPLQFYIVPKLQRRVNLLGKERVRLVRKLSDRIGETVAGVGEIHANNTARLERAQFSGQLGDIFHVRYQIYLWKFVIKFTNNTINHLGPFAFYSIGGYLVIEGSLEIGTLVAAIAAHKDLAAPWKELLTYYQRREDARIKYEQVVEQFEPPGLMDEALQLEAPAELAPLAGDIAGANLGLMDDSGQALLENANFKFDSRQHVAILGTGGAGADELAQMIARLLAPSAGGVSIGGVKLADLPEAVTGRRLGYVGPSAHMFATSVGENILYGLMHTAPPGEGAAYQRFRQEAELSGNATDWPIGDWVDYRAAGLDRPGAMTARILDVLALVDVEGDVYEMGLRSTIDPAVRPDIADGILKARAAMRERLAEPALAGLVEFHDEAKYNSNATVAENLIFGTPVGAAFDLHRLAENAYVHEVLGEAGLTDLFFDIGRQAASTMVELFADLPPGHEFFQQFSFIEADDLPAYQAILNRLAREGDGALSEEERASLLSLPFRLIPARHRLGLIGEEEQARILAARKIFKERLPDELAASIEFFDETRYNTAAPLQDNILFGKLTYGHAGGAEKIRALMTEVIEGLGLKAAVVEAGLAFQVGIGGSRLSAAQRQKLGIARALLKRPDILILNGATAALDQASQARLAQNLLRALDGQGVIWTMQRASPARLFDWVIVMRGGTVVEQGPPGELDKPGTLFSELLGAD